MANDSDICEGDIINVTCSADGIPRVHTYQLFENDTSVPDSDTAGLWKRTVSAQGSLTYRCVANNTVGTSDKNVTVTVSGNKLWTLSVMITITVLATFSFIIGK